MSKRVRTQSNANFAQTVHADIPRSIFRRNSSLKTTFNCGDLVPVYIDEVLPGDTFEMDMKFLSRLSTPIFPTMDDIKLEFYAFFVPNRLVWDGWEELNGENKTGAWTPSTEPALVPVFDDENGVLETDNILASKTIGDYYGLPVGMDFKKYPVSRLPFRGYCLIWNEWFRDENLQAPYPLWKNNDGSGAIGSYTDEYNAQYSPNSFLFRVDKFHDYFTSALPAPQKGDSPLLPVELNQLIPVITSNSSNTNVTGPSLKFLTNGDAFIDRSQSQVVVPSINNQSTSTGHIADAQPSILSSSSQYAGGMVPVNLFADASSLGNLSSTTINELRTLFQIQKLYEKDARGGTRYIEMLKAHFGVEAGDYRLQRPEFLGRFSSLVGIQSVPQTSSTDSTSPQGNLAAYSVTAGQSVLFKKSFVEHGYVHIFAVARQVKTYQQGIEKFWSRRERFDFYLPTLAHISEQPILNKEIYALANDGNDIFGYQEAWADYRYKPNRVTGQMRSGVTNSLDVWHYADKYTSTPRLSHQWIIDNSKINVNRTLAVSYTVDDQIRMDIAFDCTAIRPMPVYSIPGLVDHF